MNTRTRQRPRANRAYGRIPLLVSLLAALLSGCRREPVPGPTERIRLGIENDVICALPIIAAQNDYFKREGLDVELVPYPSGKLALNAMLKGAVDIAASADVPIMANSFTRDDFAVFATIAWTERGTWIIARKDKGITQPGDLRGKRVATQKNSAVHFFLSAFLARHGIGEDELGLVFLPAVELPDALVEGRIDAFSMRNPFIAEAKSRLGDSAVEMIDTDIYRKTFNLVAWKHALETHRASYTKLLRALVAAERLLIRDEHEARQAVVRELGAGREATIRDDWEKCTFALTLDQSLFVTLEDQARWAIKHNPDLPPEIPNYLGFVDTRPMLAAKPEAVSIIQ